MLIKENPKIQNFFQSAFDESSELKIKFEDAKRYNSALKFTFIRTFSDICKIGQSIRILEVGSFTGVVSLAMRKSGNEVYASDIDFVINDPAIVESFEQAGIQRLSVNLAEGHFPCDECFFDLIIFNEVIEHLNFNPIPLLKEFNRILKPGGMVYCATPNLLSAKNIFQILCRKGYLNPPLHLVWNLQPESGMSVGLHWREWTKEELIELFKIAGFSCVWHKYGLVTPNKSGFLRKQLVSIMYKIFPSLMPNQVGLFVKS
jgi:2-polyprenyl-3-methyl-5-hydroxy-6-metoxy-1,4-benzoquinol methylase